jgi:hypothetical protein
MEVAGHVPETASFCFEPLQNHGLSSSQSENLSKSVGRGGSVSCNGHLVISKGIYITLNETTVVQDMKQECLHGILLDNEHLYRGNVCFKEEKC